MLRNQVEQGTSARRWGNPGTGGDMPPATALPAARRPPPSRDPAWLQRVAWLSAAAVMLWPLLVATEFKPWVLWDAHSLAAVGGFLSSFFPPELDASFLVLVVRQTWRTVAMATAGIALALLIAVPM